MAAHEEKLFRKAVKAFFANHHANWPYGKNVNIGDYGIIQNGGFDRRGNIIQDFGIEFESLLDEQRDPSFEKTSSGNFHIKAQLDASGNPVATGEAKLSLSGDSLVYVRADGGVWQEIGNKQAILNAILALYRNGQWERNYVLITSTYLVERALVAVSKGKEASLEISADADVPMESWLGNASLSFKIGATKNVGFKFTLVNTPLAVGLHGIRGLFNPHMGLMEAASNKMGGKAQEQMVPLEGDWDDWGE